MLEAEEEGVPTPSLSSFGTVLVEDMHAVIAKDFMSCVDRLCLAMSSKYFHRLVRPLVLALPSPFTSWSFLLAASIGNDEKHWLQFVWLTKELQWSKKAIDFKTLLHFALFSGNEMVTLDLCDIIHSRYGVRFQYDQWSVKINYVDMGILGTSPRITKQLGSLRRTDGNAKADYDEDYKYSMEFMGALANDNVQRFVETIGGIAYQFDFMAFAEFLLKQRRMCMIAKNLFEVHGLPEEWKEYKSLLSSADQGPRFQWLQARLLICMEHRFYDMFRGHGTGFPEPSLDLIRTENIVNNNNKYIGAPFDHKALHVTPDLLFVHKVAGQVH